MEHILDFERRDFLEMLEIKSLQKDGIEKQNRCIINNFCYSNEGQPIKNIDKFTCWQLKCVFVSYVKLHF